MALTGRNLQRISHTDYDPVVITTSGKRAATVVQGDGYQNPAFAVDYILREGATLYQPNNNWRYTVEAVSGNNVVLKQPAVATSYWDSGPWYTSITDGGYPSSWVYPSLSNQLPPANRRDRGGDHLDQYAGVAGVLVPDAAHYIYLSPVDEVGDPDYYVYFCTIVPVKGVHPFTGDVAVGLFKTGPKGGNLVESPAIRVRKLEGALRAGRSASSTSQDYRLADLVARFRALEDWANRVGTNSPPTPGSNATYTESDFVVAGDI